MAVCIPAAAGSGSSRLSAFKSFDAQLLRCGSRLRPRFPARDADSGPRSWALPALSSGTQIKREERGKMMD
jgi:hypothetical protein